MEINIDLQHAKNTEVVLSVFSKKLFGGWGTNWDAFNDCMRYLDVGGIDGHAPKLHFPIKLIIKNYEAFEENDPKNFGILKEIMVDQEKEWKDDGEDLTVIFE